MQAGPKCNGGETTPWLGRSVTGRVVPWLGERVGERQEAAGKLNPRSESLFCRMYCLSVCLIAQYYGILCHTHPPYGPPLLLGPDDLTVRSTGTRSAPSSTLPKLGPERRGCFDHLHTNQQPIGHALMVAVVVGCPASLPVQCISSR
jgi:hypothetical protein